VTDTKQIAVSFTLARLQGFGAADPAHLNPSQVDELAVRTLLHMVNPRYDHEILSLTRIGDSTPSPKCYLRFRTAMNGARVMLEGTSATWWGAVVRAYASQGWRGRFNQEAARAAVAVYALTMKLQDAKLTFDFRDERVNLPIGSELTLSRWSIDDWLNVMERVGEPTAREFIDWFRLTPEPPTDADVLALGDELDRMVLP
jgi:hypothetical protein